MKLISVSDCYPNIRFTKNVPICSPKLIVVCIISEVKVYKAKKQMFDESFSV